MKTLKDIDCLDRWGNYTIHVRGEDYDQVIKTHYIEIAEDSFNSVAVYFIMNGWDARVFLPVHDIISIEEAS